MKNPGCVLLFLHLLDLRHADQRPHHPSVGCKFRLKNTMGESDRILSSSEGDRDEWTGGMRLGRPGWACSVVFGVVSVQGHFRTSMCGQGFIDSRLLFFSLHFPWFSGVSRWFDWMQCRLFNPELLLLFVASFPAPAGQQFLGAGDRGHRTVFRGRFRLPLYPGPRALLPDRSNTHKSEVIPTFDKTNSIPCLLLGFRYLPQERDLIQLKCQANRSVARTRGSEPPFVIVHQ